MRFQYVEFPTTQKNEVQKFPHAETKLKQKIVGTE